MKFDKILTPCASFFAFLTGSSNDFKECRKKTRLPQTKFINGEYVQLSFFYPRVDKIIVKKQPYQLLNTNCEFFPSFDASNFRKLVNESS